MGNNGERFLINTSGAVGIGTNDIARGQLEIKPSIADRNHGITLFAGTGVTARSYLKNDGNDDFNWHLTRAGTRYQRHYH